MAESVGFEQATIQGRGGEAVLDKKLRKGGRCILDKPDLAEDLYKRTIAAMDDYPTLKNKFLHAPWITLRSDEGIPRYSVGLNERFRFLRNKKGDKFGVHRCIPFVRGVEYGDRVGEMSHVTFVVFLNDKMKGGMLRFVGSDDRYYDVHPKAGSIAIFDHDIPHEDCVITSGRKYAIKTDVMYTTKEP